MMEGTHSVDEAEVALSDDGAVVQKHEVTRRGAVRARYVHLEEPELSGERSTLESLHYRPDNDKGSS